jgi:hypothetical protein
VTELSGVHRFIITGGVTWTSNGLVGQMKRSQDGCLIFVKTTANPRTPLMKQIERRNTGILPHSTTLRVKMTTALGANNRAFGRMRWWVGSSRVVLVTTGLRRCGSKSSFAKSRLNGGHSAPDAESPHLGIFPIVSAAT